ncbi:hypothetical protein ACJX0J_006414, partial [Zea mays]
DVQGGGRGQEGVRGRHPRHQRPPRQLQPRRPRRQAAPPATHPPPFAAGHPGAARARAPLATPAHASHRRGVQGRVAGAVVLPPLHDAAATGRAPLRPRRAPAVPRRAPVLPRRRRHLRVRPELRRGPELQCEGRPGGSWRHGRVLPAGALRVPGGGGSAGRHGGGGAQRHGAGVPVLPLPPVPRLAGGSRRRALLPPGLRRRRPRRRLQAHRHGRSQ